jgi:hypothetical protein
MVTGRGFNEVVGLPTFPQLRGWQKYRQMDILVGMREAIKTVIQNCLINCHYKMMIAD